MSIIHSGNYYRFKSLADNKYLNILTYGNLKNNVNVTTFALNTRDDCQIWKCDPYSANGIEGFLMKSKRNENYVLDAYWGTSNLNNADIYSLMSTDNDVKDQLVVFMSYGDSYRIKLKYKNLYLTNDMSDTYEGHDVRWAPLSNTDNQLWRAEVVGADPVTPVSTVPSAIANHTYLLRNKKSGLNLNVYGTNTVANNRNVTIYTKENVAAQKWKAVQTSGGPKLVTEINNAFALNINTNGNKCTMYTAAGNDYDSVLDFIHVSGNSYRIRIHNYSLYLTATGNERGDLVKWDSDMSDASVWEFVEEEDMFTTMTHAPDTLLNKTFFVRNMSTGLNLNVHGSDTVANSRNVNTYTRENCQAQRWTVQNTLAGAKIFTAINPSYALNIYGSNCTMYIARGNDNDSVIELDPYSLPEKIFRIKMYNHDKYLCATGIADGSNATWENYNSDGCLWQFIEEEEMFPPAGVVPRELVGKTLFVQAEGTDYNLNVHGTDTVANSTNVNLYRKENCLAQRWCARQDSAGPKLYSAIDSAFALNINTNNNNCTMYTAIGNDNDSVLDFERVGPMRYRIKLYNHNKYLYVDGDIATGTNVKWTSSVSQATIWKFASPSEIEFDEIGEGSLDGAESYLVTHVIPADPSNFTPNRVAQGASITKICIHHTAGEMSVQALGSLWQRPTRAGSSHYGVHDNDVGQYVSESDIAWTNGHWESNCSSVTIETSNDVSYSQGDARNWTVSSKTLNTLIKLVADIARRNNLGALVPGENLTWHSMYKATVCPGPYLLSQMMYIAEQANVINQIFTTPDYQEKYRYGAIIHPSTKTVYPIKIVQNGENFNINDYGLDDTYTNTVHHINWATFISGFRVSDDFLPNGNTPNNPGAEAAIAGSGLIATAISSLVQSLESARVDIEFYTGRNAEDRFAFIKLYNNEMESVFRRMSTLQRYSAKHSIYDQSTPNAGDIIYWKAMVDDIARAQFETIFNRPAIDLYEYDIVYTFDERRKTESYFSYVFIDEMGNFCKYYRLYDGEKFEISENDPYVIDFQRTYYDVTNYLNPANIVTDSEKNLIHESANFIIR